MKVTFLTAGTGSYHCGACMRDNTLVTSLHKAGHEVSLLPMYLPMQLDEEALPQVQRAPIFFGGINVYLQQKFRIFRHTPRWLDRLMNGRGLLRSAAKRSHMTSPRDQGEMCLAMLQVEESKLTKELDKLVDWLEHHERPEVIALSNSMLCGLTRELKKRLGDIPVITFFQGEDTFLDSLPEPYRSKSWEEMKERLAQCDVLVAPSRFYAGLMTERLGLAEGRIEVLPNGINLEGYGDRREGGPQAIGYLARMSREKGLGDLVDAYLLFQEAGGFPSCRLRIAGACTLGDEEFVEEQKKKIERAGLSELVDWYPNVTREEKAEFLRGLTVFSVPVQYPEAFGLYLVEAMASGVPVVNPAAWSFPEIAEETGGGRVVAAGDLRALVRGWEELLADPAEIVAMGERGRRGVEERYSVAAMRDGFVEIAGRILAAAGRPDS
ncbi:MAG: glycosyl transferase group 1 [Verrucomicrobiaceae bacterium]|nr:glycosyl transferase group 1 [Verrucomicrobiaceae bacterium]